jgi:uncharacterized protein YyaL (SSP411 family)
MNIALCKAAGALGGEACKELAVRNMDFMLKNFKGNETHLFFHCYAGGKAKFPAFLDDYAFLIAALIQLQEITSDESYLLKAKELTEYAIEHFAENDTSPLFYTHKNQDDVIVRKKEIYDGAIPSGNAVMAFNLLYLSIIFDKPAWRDRTINICFALSRTIIRYPNSFGVWATLMQAITNGIPEIAITGKYLSEELVKIRKDFLHTFIPYKVYQSATRENVQFPLLTSKIIHDKPQIYLCRNYSCLMPVGKISELMYLLADA